MAKIHRVLSLGRGVLPKQPCPCLHGVSRSSLGTFEGVSKKSWISKPCAPSAADLKTIAYHTMEILCGSSQKQRNFTMRDCPGRIKSANTESHGGLRAGIPKTRRLLCHGSILRAASLDDGLKKILGCNVCRRPVSDSKMTKLQVMEDLEAGFKT